MNRGYFVSYNFYLRATILSAFNPAVDNPALRATAALRRTPHEEDRADGLDEDPDVHPR